jgi:hypothetical protein
VKRSVSSRGHMVVPFPSYRLQVTEGGSCEVTLCDLINFDELCYNDQ